MQNVEELIPGEIERGPTRGDPRELRGRIRLATPGEVESFARFAEKDGVHLLMPPPPSGEETAFYVGFIGVKPVPVGIGGIMRYAGGARLRGAWVNEHFRRNGLWWALVDHRVDVARAWGVPYVETWAVHPGPLLRNGWRVASERHRNGAVHVRLDFVHGSPVASVEEVRLVREQGECLTDSYGIPGAADHHQPREWHDGRTLLALADRLSARGG